MIGLGTDHAASLPYASSLCGACYEVCPVKIDIPEVLLHLRGEVIRKKGSGFLNVEGVAMKGAAWAMGHHRRFEAAQKAARLGQGPLVNDGQITFLPGLLGGWTSARDLAAVPPQSFRDWWKITGEPMKDAVLARIRAALKDVPATETPESVAVPREYRVETWHPDLLELFVERATEYRAHVTVVSEAELSETIAARLALRNVTTLAVPADLPTEWLSGFSGEIRRDTPGAPLSKAALDATDAVLTASALAIAETGTIVLNGGEFQGRRILTLLPDYHLCVVWEETIHDNVPTAIRELSSDALGNPRPLTMISGPSATSDIELNRVEGVHGPRILDVLVLRK